MVDSDPMALMDQMDLMDLTVPTDPMVHPDPLDLLDHRPHQTVETAAQALQDLQVPLEILAHPEAQDRLLQELEPAPDSEVTLLPEVPETAAPLPMEETQHPETVVSIVQALPVSLAPVATLPQVLQDPVHQVHTRTTHSVNTRVQVNPDSWLGWISYRFQFRNTHPHKLIQVGAAGQAVVVVGQHLRASSWEWVISCTVVLVLVDLPRQAIGNTANRVKVEAILL